MDKTLIDESGFLLFAELKLHVNELLKIVILNKYPFYFKKLKGKKDLYQDEKIIGQLYYLTFFISLPASVGQK